MSVEQEPALCQAILFSDYVIREKGTDRLSIINSFNKLYFPHFPCLTPPFFLSIFLTHLRGKIDSLDITARVEDPHSGHVLASCSGKIGFPADSPSIEETTILDLTLPVTPFLVSQQGIYSVVILVNNEKIGERILPVLLLPPSFGVHSVLKPPPAPLQ
ncbi:hypothetical protein A7K73_00165 [Candidatus Methylacidiphilum fumarolicum]|uniref:Uncharacterized protein n=1 Tax=Methylacidiphilum fumariolicum (strain SolV) TaxID=1156937 RepID=I0JYN9_METFB|nr:hypothetical protein A7K73_00165 [Candidatus Methylacidiphilum fumarolicum]TFE78010.1 hypothetical protein A7D33_00385 [Candidatus Methylacidiphilum fumarolicum]CCG92358.1 conserved hypothetical protein [Methylacidiphilum fumariolicum SolV]